MTTDKLVGTTVFLLVYFSVSMITVSLLALTDFDHGKYRILFFYFIVRHVKTRRLKFNNYIICN